MYSVHTATHSEVHLSPARLADARAAGLGSNASIALLVHELRSPLASIQNAIAVLRHPGSGALQARMHDLIERQVRQIARLTSSRFEVSPSHVVKVELDRRRIDLGAVLNRAVETVAPAFLSRRNGCVVDLPKSSIWIHGDAGRLEQVFVNLLANASKYSAVGAEVYMSLHVAEGQAVARVRDFGVGIEAASLPFIFDLFMRANTADVRERSGLGIGLALVRSIVELHGGGVTASSNGAGQGSEFTVRLKSEA